MSAVARRYARAAVEAAEAQGGTAAVQELARDFAAFCEAFVASSELRELLVNPAFKIERQKVLGGVLAKVVPSVSASRLVTLLAEADRIAVLDEVRVAIAELADRASGRARAIVTSAVALTKAHEERIAKALGTRLGRTVELSVRVDPEILGGLVCQVGDLTFDSSLRRQLAVMRERLEGRGP